MNERKRCSIKNRPCLICAVYCLCEILAFTSGFEIEDLIQRGMAQHNEVRRAFIIFKTRENVGAMKQDHNKNMHKKPKMCSCGSDEEQDWSSIQYRSPAQLAPLHHTPFTANPIHSFQAWAKSKQMLQRVRQPVCWSG